MRRPLSLDLSEIKKADPARILFHRKKIKTAWELSRGSHTREDAEQHSNIGTGSAIDVPLAAAEPAALSIRQQEKDKPRIITIMTRSP